MDNNKIIVATTFIMLLIFPVMGLSEYHITKSINTNIAGILPENVFMIKATFPLAF